MEVRWQDAIADALGCRSARVIFERHHLSRVTALELADGRRVVMKARPASPHVEASIVVHRFAHARGLPVPAILAGPLEVDGLTVTFEAMIDLPEHRTVPTDHAAKSAALLARLVGEVNGPLRPSGSRLCPPPWLDAAGLRADLWPPPDDLGVDLMDLPRSWIDDAAEGVRNRVQTFRGEQVIAHSDWELHNIIWGAAGPWVLDWDSAMEAPEAVVVGAAATVFEAGRRPGVVAADVAGTTRFLAGFQRSRGRTFDAEELQVAWASGLWVLLFNAKKELAEGFPGSLDHLDREYRVRALHAGLEPAHR